MSPPPQYRITNRFPSTNRGARKEKEEEEGDHEAVGAGRRDEGQDRDAPEGPVLPPPTEVLRHRRLGTADQLGQILGRCQEEPPPTKGIKLNTHSIVQTLFLHFLCYLTKH